MVPFIHMFNCPTVQVFNFPDLSAVSSVFYSCNYSNLLCITCIVNTNVI